MPFYIRHLSTGLAAMALSACAASNPGAPSLSTTIDGSAPAAQAQQETPASTTDTPTSRSPESQTATSPAQARTTEATPSQTRPIETALPVDADLPAFINGLARQYDLDPARLGSILAQARNHPGIARAILPAAAMPPAQRTPRSWSRYRDRFVEPIRIRHGLSFWQQHADILQRASQQYGVPENIIVAIIGVETLYGRHTGNYRTLDALYTLGFHYPDPARPDRQQMFRDNLADFLVWTLKEDNIDPLQVRGSYAGAIGLPQFMPSSLRRYAVDGDGDGHIDLLGNPADAIMSVANFLVRHGWQPGLPVFAPAKLPDQPHLLVDGGLTPTLDWSRLKQAGAAAEQANWQQHPLGIIDLKDEVLEHTSYRVATPNFFALTQYNRSYFYATAVADLAAALQDAR